MSKESRRAARLARESRRVQGAGRPTAAGSAGTAGGGPSSAGPVAAGAGTRRPVGTPATRAGRRERVRPYSRQSFLDRYRNTIVGVAAVAIAALAIGWVFVGSTSAAYTCGNAFDPSPTPTLSPGSSTRLGFVEEDMGRSHTVNPPQKYLYCPPASGNHLNGAGVGPIQPRVYKPGDKVGPSNWVHNLEHGGLVVLYKGDSTGATTAGQQAFKQFFDSFPPTPICKVPAGQTSPVIARFDDMPHPFAVLVWGRVFYLDSWDPNLVLQFYNTEAERLDSNGDLVAPPEDISGCAARLASSAPSAAPSGAAPSGAAPSGAAPSGAAPSGAAPSGTVPSSAPSASPPAVSAAPSAAPSASGSAAPS